MGNLSFHTRCGFLLPDTETVRSFIHNFYFRCKINKFISFFSKKQWKTLKLPLNKPVDIPFFIALYGKLLIIHKVFHIVIHRFSTIFCTFVTDMKKLRTIEMNRLTVDEFKQAEKLPLIVVLDDVRSMHNVGSVFRTGDAFRIEAVYLCGITSVPPSAEIHKTALGAEDSVKWVYFKTALEALEALKADGYEVYSIEQAHGSTMLQDFTPIYNNRYAVVLGNEVKGVHQEVVDASDGCLEIPQFGTKHSMNVSVTAGIVIWHFAQTIINK